MCPIDRDRDRASIDDRCQGHYHMDEREVFPGRVKTIKDSGKQM